LWKSNRKKFFDDDDDVCEICGLMMIEHTFSEMQECSRCHNNIETKPIQIQTKITQFFHGGTA